MKIRHAMSARSTQHPWRTFCGKSGLLGLCLVLVLPLSLPVTLTLPVHAADASMPVQGLREPLRSTPPPASTQRPVSPPVRTQVAPPASPAVRTQSPAPARPVTVQPAPVTPSEPAQTEDSAATSNNENTTGDVPQNDDPIEPAQAEPAQAAAPAQNKKSDIRLFGSIEFKGTFKGLKEWQSVLERNKARYIFKDDFKLNSSTTWGMLKQKLQKMTPMEQIRAVNTFWNQWPYRTDREVYGKEDYWAIPDEFRKNSGDCEDYSIAKYFTLKELGFKSDQMRIVVVKETIRNIAHAVLAVYLDDNIYILDNLSQNALEHSRIRNYQPQFSVNEDFRWAHVRPK